MTPTLLLPANVPKGFHKLASSLTLPKLEESITRFYGGEHKELREAAPGRWSVHRLSDGKILSEGAPACTTVPQTRRGYYFGVLQGA